MLFEKFDHKSGGTVVEGFSSRGLKRHQTNEFNFENHDFFEKFPIFCIFCPFVFVQEVRLRNKKMGPHRFGLSIRV